MGLLFAHNQADAEELRVLPDGKLPNDRRLEPLKDLNGYFPFAPCATPGEWHARSETVRRNLSVALGLWPMPEKTPLNPVVHGRIERDEYTIEKVYFESVPGFFVTGNLYRPKGKSGRLPAVLSPHGHWPDGRFMDAKPADPEKDIAKGGERFKEGGRSPLQARCVQLARMGCVVFHYDMIGYADSLQISQALAHGFARQRPEMNASQGWGFFSPRAEGHLQSILGLQAWNSIRALDFLLSLPYVDAKRVGVTGASGGGTQTFLLCALDPRPAAAFPAVMVSTAMQGGCTCENASFLRVDTGNVEIAALFAPKPLGMTAANDWTKEMPGKGFPELQQHFRMLGHPDNVALTPLLQFGHNYNYPSRAAMYGWFNRHLKLGLTDTTERDYRYSTRQELTVWSETHKQPSGGAEFETGLLRWIHDRDQEQLRKSHSQARAFREVYGRAMDAIIGRNLATAGSVCLDQSAETEFGGYRIRTGLLRNGVHGEELPMLEVIPGKSRNETVIWVDPAGKAGLFSGDEGQRKGLVPEVRKLVNAGITVIGVDLLFQGEFLTNGQPMLKARKVANPREAAAYTFGYNYPLFAQRVHDLVTVIQYAKTRGGFRKVHLAGLPGAGHWAAAAKAQAGKAIDCAAIDTRGFRFAHISDIYDVNFMPGALKYGDLPGMLALGAPGKLFLGGEPAVPELTATVYAISHGKKKLTIAKTGRSFGAELVEWLLAEPR